MNLYINISDRTSYGMFQHKTVSYVHMYCLYMFMVDAVNIHVVYIVHPFSISAEFVACTCKHACTMPSNHGLHPLHESGDQMSCLQQSVIWYTNCSTFTKYGISL